MIKINGVIFEGNNLTIRNNQIIIDGKTQNINDKVINIVVEGDIKTLDVGSCDKIEVKGNVGVLKSMSGNIECGDVSDSVTSSSGDISAKSIGGNVTTSSGDVTCEGSINGSVKTSSGDIKSAKRMMKD